MIYSMTAFASAETIQPPFGAAIEIRSYNSRFLDIIVKMPKSYAALENKIKQSVSQRITRGRIEIKLGLKQDEELNAGYEIDTAKARSYYHALKQLKEHFSLTGDIPLELLAGVEGIIKPAENIADLESGWMITKSCLDKALENLIAMRKEEGAFLGNDFDKRLEIIENALKKIESKSDDVVMLYIQRLKERISVLTQGTVSPDPDRLAQEVAIIADKSDISEEIVRAASHIDQFRHIMGSEEAGGRRLNFLVQELHRELNTIGAKSVKTDVSHRVVNIKSELEKIREQVQNIE